MSQEKNKYDTIIIGGGIFGLYSAHMLSSKGKKVAILERERDIFEGASKVNQARVHRGYHYPRSLETASKTNEYYTRFCNDFNFAMLKPFRQYYAISEKNTKTSVDEYIRFCKVAGIPLKEVDSSLFFKGGMVSALFEVKESCFDYLKIKEYFLEEFNKVAKVDIYRQTDVTAWEIVNSQYLLSIKNTSIQLIAPLVINATYGNVNYINRMFGFTGHGLKYELCELNLCRMKGKLSNIGFTVMDGPFFSLMPYGDGTTYSLYSVKFTPVNTSYANPQSITDYIGSNKSNGETIKLLAESYLNKDIRFDYIDSIFAIKSVLTSSDEDDSRPTVITIHSKNPYFISVLAGKISTIYDLEEKLYQIINNI